MWTDGANIERQITQIGETGAIINGSFVQLNPGDGFAETVLALAHDAGYGKFRVFLNNEELEAEDAPAQISEGDVIKIIAFDVAG